MSDAQRYKDKVTIVTGGSKGIGRGCVEVFVKHGSKVVFCARGEEEGKKLEAELNKTGPGSAFFMKCDMRNEDDIKRMIDCTVEKYGRLDCVINNAGWHPLAARIDDISADDFRKLLDYNLVSYFLVAKYSLPHLRMTKGNIIQDSSMVAEIGKLEASTYAATKGGVTALTKSLAIDEAANGVRINTFSPQNIWTPLWETLAKGTSDFEKSVQLGKDCQLLGRFGTAEECGKVCLFLATDATFCTGVNILVSGGSELNYGVKNPKALGNY